MRTTVAATPRPMARRIRSPPNTLFTSNVTPVPATMLLMRAIMLAAVVKNATSAPDQRGGAERPSGHRPLSAQKYTAASGVSVR